MVVEEANITDAGAIAKEIYLYRLFDVLVILLPLLIE